MWKKKSNTKILSQNKEYGKTKSVTEYYIICTLCIVGNPAGSGPLEMCNYCGGDSRPWEKAKDKMYKAMEKTLCC